MSRSNMTIGCAKCFIVFMGTTILVQGLIYLGLAIVGVVHDCTVDTYQLKEDSFLFALDVVYFIREKCGAPILEYDGSNRPLDVDWSKSDAIKNRFDSFLYIYIVISFIWVLTSLFIIFSLCLRMTERILGLCFWPWFISVLIGSAFDVIATGFHINDIVHTTSIQNTFDYVGIRDNITVIPELDFLEGYSVLPSVIMICISCRFVAIWILNILGAIFVLVIVTDLHKMQNRRRDVDRLSNTSTVTPTVQQRIDKVIIVGSQQKEPEFVDNQKAVGNESRNADANNRYSHNLNVYGAPLENENQQNYNTKPTTPIYAYISTPSLHNEETNRPTSDQAGDGITYRNTDTHPDHLNYPSSPQPSSALSSEILLHTPVNQRYSNIENSMHGIGQAQPSNRASEELRGQLPWSYTSSFNKPQPVNRKSQLPGYPEIPEPDYSTPYKSSSPNAQQGYSKF